MIKEREFAKSKNAEMAEQKLEHITQYGDPSNEVKSKAVVFALLSIADEVRCVKHELREVKDLLRAMRL